MTSPAHWLNRGRLLAGVIGLLSANVAVASTNSDWRVRVWQSDDGLPDNNVTSLAQTPDGFLWAGSPSSLARFDGFNFDAGTRVSVMLPWPAGKQG